PEIHLPDAGYSTIAGRRHFDFRYVATGRDRSEVIRCLSENTAGKIEDISNVKGERRLAFMFSGQGTQYLGMGSGLYRDIPSFREDIDRLLKIASELGDEVLGPCIRDGRQLSEAQLKNTIYVQPMLFMIEYSMARLLSRVGLVPEFLFGHSVGEVAAAAFSGMFDIRDALLFVMNRAKWMSALPEGGMLSVRTSHANLLEILPSSLDIAAVNAGDLCVVAGPHEEISEFQKLLEREKILCKPLHTSHAFHSRMVEPVCGKLRELLSGFRFNSPGIPILSSVTGELLDDAKAMDPEYWASHARVTVNFEMALKAALKSENISFVEVGPRNALSSLAYKQAHGKKGFVSVSTMGDKSGDSAEWTFFIKAMAALWQHGYEISLEETVSHYDAKRLWVPGYPFSRVRYWLMPDGNMSLDSNSKNLLSEAGVRKEQGMREKYIRMLRDEIATLLEEASGIRIDEPEDGTNFMALGFDSLFLTQAAINLQNRFKIKVAFRQLMEDITCLRDLAEYMAKELPESAASYAVEEETPLRQVSGEADYSESSRQYPAYFQHESATTPPVCQPSSTQGVTTAYDIFAQQIALMQQQIQLLYGQKGLSLHSAWSQPASNPAVSGPLHIHWQKAPEDTMRKDQGMARTDEPPHGADVIRHEQKEMTELKKQSFGAIARITKKTDRGMSRRQRDALERFTESYTKKTMTSKNYAQKYRKCMADPRVVTGFKPYFKEVVYPLVIARSSGVNMWDIDGNQYIDMLCGFGSCFFGYQPDFIMKYVKEQLDQGIELGPQCSKAGEASELAVELTGMDRVAFCNTGSEAVLGAMRMARTVTGRQKIASFNGSYHGINDEVIVRGTKTGRPVAAAPGIMQGAVQNMMVLDYGTEESLRVLREHAHELAAILVEPVQSRRPEWRPFDFLRDLRNLTREKGCALIFDEVITGFRYHPGGVQRAIGIRPDLSTYGKVVGGGMPIGMIGGVREYMDALDGGYWSFGDGSIPEVGVTYFAGTFVRHPLAMAAAVATLRHLKQEGPNLQKGVNEMADGLCAELNSMFEKMGAPYKYCNFGSMMKLKIIDETLPLAELFATWIRSKGVHIIDGFPTFLTTAHREEHIHKIMEAFRVSLEEMGRGGLLESEGESVTVRKSYFTDDGEKPIPDVDGARMGLDADGNPAWFVEDPDSPGTYRQIG
ncbi:MAG: aminotransferase class III-fold pyridoxal phosphate-dependent enzyme, partial [Oligoflexales bacterium]|nr:aminotransferase class III-fold pyridoxal phosphate-dependent enzyme [Oligoflexales bacterium]